MLNKVTLMGRITKPIELKKTQNDVSVASFTLAVERDYQGGGKEKAVDFIDCVAWRNTADFVSKYFSKGSMMALCGSLQSRKWEDKNGNKRINWEVIADNVYFCGKKETATADVSAEDWQEADNEEDLPF